MKRVREIVSVPYLSGQALQLNHLVADSGAEQFQSPICRGRRCNLLCRWPSRSTPAGFSPLFVGAGVAIGLQEVQES